MTGAPLSIDVILSLYGSIIGSLYSNTADSLSDDFAQISFKEPDILAENELDLIDSQPIIDSLLLQTSFDDFDEYVQDVIDSLEQQSTTLLFIFAVAAFYIIVRSENPKIKIQTYNRVLSFIFISILASSAIVSPFSISSSYYAHAQSEQNLTDSQAEAIQNPSISSNSTQVLPPANIIRYDYDVVPVNATLPAAPVNATLPIIVPNATQSWGANTTTTDLEQIGGVYINQTGLVIDGGFFRSDEDTNETSALTVAAWIKPVYSGGSSVFTIISKDKSFELTLNNVLYPQHTAAFSVFDGIKWHKVESIAEIGEGWSHVAATFNGTEISIYVNGTLSNTAKTAQTIIVSTEGSTENAIPQISNTDSDVVIGATLDARTIDTAQQAFSGTLDQVQTYDVCLTAEQIFELYQQTLPLILAKLVPPVIEEIELVPINLLNQTQVNGTINANVTEPIILPAQTVKDQFTIISWITPNYTDASDEYTIVSKEKSFILSVNNFIPPQHTPKFAVFDGIHWTEQLGKSTIENRSHLAAVVNGTELLLYVNGTLESQTTLPKSIVLVDGDLVAIPAEIASSNSSIVIGAYLSTLRSEPSISNKFFGAIDELVLHPYALSEEEIKALYIGRIPQITDVLLSENIEISDLVSFQATNQTVTGIDLTVEPVVDAKPSYLINEDIEIQLEYLDQYAVLTNELTELDDALSDIIPQTEQNLAELEEQIINGTSGITVDQTPQDTPVDQTPQDTPVDQTQVDVATTNQTETSTNQPIITENQTLANAPESGQNSTGIDLNIAGYLIFPFIQAAHADDIPDTYVALEQITTAKEEIHELKEKISGLKQDQNVTEIAITELKDQIKSVSDSLRSVNDNISNEQQDEQINDLVQTFDTIVEENATKIQYTEWRDQSNTITVQVFDSQGTLVQTISEYEKIREGKFNIRLSPQETVVPGVYYVKTILEVNGNQYVLEDEFAWGLVSLNTKKSIYKPGETADFVIVVLDNKGHPVCDSDISMTITDPQNQNTTLTSQNGITKNADCGLYDSQYDTSLEGNHTVDISATTPNGATSFSTYFTVKEFFDYDIVRTAQSKIDPIFYPNSFNVTINIESYVGGDQVTIREHVPSVFDVVTDGNVTQTDNTKTITWQKTLDESKTSVSYSYS
ncbi:MAG: LamG-like jellyroll fold domain-containing protein, partial [Candidatus Nitrosotenuis sp.]